MFLKSLFFFACVFLLNIQSFASSKHFKVSYDPDYAPFSYVNNNVAEGLLIDYWKLWAKRNNYTVEFINGKSWQRATLLAKYKKVDFFAGAEPYEDWMKASKAFYKTQTSIFIRQSDSNSYNTNSHIKIGIIGKDYTDKVLKALPYAQIVVYDDYEPIIEDLISSKIDMLYDDKIAIEFYTLQNRYFHEIKSINLINDHTPKCAISRDKRLIKIFNAGLEKITKKELEEIKTKWILNQDFKFFRNNSNDLKLTKEEKEFLKNRVIKVASSNDWKPFNFKIDEKTDGGISSEIWDLLENKLNIKSEYKFHKEFTQQLLSIKDKTQDVIISTGLTKEREKYSLFSDPYISFPLSIVTLKDENYIENISYLFDKKIAVGKNFTAHKILKEKYPNMNFYLAKSIKDGLKAVESGKAYAFIDIKPALTYNIKKLGFDDLKIIANTDLNFELRVMIRDDYPLLQSALNKAILSLEPIEVEAIIQKWENIQFEDSFDYEKLWFILILVIALFTLLIMKNRYAQKKNKELEEMVKARTKELIYLNETLEQRVKHKTKELIEANTLLDEAQKIAHLGSYQYEIEENELKWSSELYKIFEMIPNRAQPSKELLIKFVHKDDKEFVKKELDKALHTVDTYTFEFRVVIRNEVKFLQSTSKASKVDEKNNPLSLIGTILDLTKIKTLENEKREKDSILAQQAKMAAMGEMLENIAHQWRQPLSVISTASTGIQIQQELTGEVKEDFLLDNIKSINKQAQYLSKTIDDFRNFFNPNKIKGYFDIEHSIEKAMYLINSKVKTNHIDVVFDIEKK